MKLKFTITGGAGFIGTNLCEFLLAEGHDVVVVDNLTAGKRENLPAQVSFYKTDIRDTETLVKQLQETDVVVHLAALPRVQFSIDNPTEAHDVNVNGTLSVLEAAKQAKVGRVVFAASSSAYGDQETLPLSEDMKAEPKSPYALHKLIGEEYMRLWNQLFDIETVSLRFFNVYGPHLDPDGPYALVIGRFLKQAVEKTPLTITGDGTQTRDFTHVTDVCRAVLAAGTKNTVGKGEVLNVGCGQQTTINDLAKMISDEVEYVPPRIEPKHTLADISTTKKLLDWEPRVTLKEGIKALKSEMLR